MKTNPLPVIAPPTDLKEAMATSETLMKLACRANELDFQIRERHEGIATLYGQLADVRKEYLRLQPKIRGVLKPLSPQ